MCYRWDIHAPVIAPINKFDVNWSSMRALPCLCGSLVFEHARISWGRRTSWTNLSCAWCMWKLTRSHYCLSIPGRITLCFLLVLICKWSSDDWNYRKLKKNTRMLKNPLSFPNCASAEHEHSQQPVELPQLNFSGDFSVSGSWASFCIAKYINTPFSWYVTVLKACL